MVASARSHGERPSCLLSVERQGAVTPKDGVRRARQLSPARRVATSSHVVVSMVSRQFEGGRERSVTCDTFWREQVVFKCAYRSTEIVWRNLQNVASVGHPDILTSFWPVACGWTAGLFLFAFIGTCIVGSCEIYNVRLACSLNMNKKPSWRRVLHVADPSGGFDSL